MRWPIVIFDYIWHGIYNKKTESFIRGREFHPDRCGQDNGTRRTHSALSCCGDGASYCTCPPYHVPLQEYPRPRLRLISSRLAHHRSGEWTDTGDRETEIWNVCRVRWDMYVEPDAHPAAQSLSHTHAWRRSISRSRPITSAGTDSPRPKGNSGRLALPTSCAVHLYHNVRRPLTLERHITTPVQGEPNASATVNVSRDVGPDWLPAYSPSRLMEYNL
jgi:hypothetical protein